MGREEYMKRPEPSSLDVRDVKGGFQALKDQFEKRGLDGASSVSKFIERFLKSQTIPNLKEADPLFKWRRRMNRTHMTQKSTEFWVSLLISSAEKSGVPLPK
ncbi:MAG: hypothetical protein OXU73_00090 [Candidatus Campbellbacteria bacterium]|nr:hypothetical protein [Candidatus Campbellbacteria bacterium]